MLMMDSKGENEGAFKEDPSTRLGDGLSEDKLEETALSFHHVGSRNQIQAVRLSNNHLYL